jgi:dienelactone hydrolase
MRTQQQIHSKDSAKLCSGWHVYSKSMPKRAFLFLVMLALKVPAFAQQSAATNSNPRIFPVGTVVPKLVALGKPDQSYALYLPASYSTAKRWPIIYAFDPGANGSRPVELMKDAAERYGYIVVGSNNSRNGSWKIELEAAQAMSQDTRERFSVDSRRIYMAGFSGGARVAARLAQICKCTAGVLLNGAGFQPEVSASPDGRFGVFATVGTFDFNYGEVVQLDDQLEKLGYAHFLRRFKGPHQWAPESALDEALAWFRLQAMRNGQEERDDSFVAAQAAREAQRANALDQSGNLYDAWKEYRQAAEMFAGLADNAALRARAEALEKEKSVRDGAKREMREFDDQEQLIHEIYARLSALQEYQENGPEIRRIVRQDIVSLRERTEREKSPEKLRVLKRALAGVLGLAMDTGLARLDQKDVHRALDYFELACNADPDSVWALTELAIAKVAVGDRKGALEALHHASAKTKNPEGFAAWLNEEPAFAKLRGSPEFTALLQPAPQH